MGSRLRGNDDIKDAAVTHFGSSQCMFAISKLAGLVHCVKPAARRQREARCGGLEINELQAERRDLLLRSDANRLVRTRMPDGVGGVGAS
jgi:hypothetical protein